MYFLAPDNAAFFAVNAYLLRPVSSGTVKAVGRVVSEPTSQFIAESVLYDEEGKEIARGSGVFMKSRIEIRPELLDPNKILHGGVPGTLADMVSIFGCIYLYEAASVTTVGMNLPYLKSAESGAVTATAKVLSRGKSISQWPVDIADDDDRSPAVASVSYSIKR